MSSYEILRQVECRTVLPLRNMTQRNFTDSWIASDPVPLCVADSSRAVELWLSIGSFHILHILTVICVPKVTCL